LIIVSEYQRTGGRKLHLHSLEDGLPIVEVDSDCLLYDHGGICAGPEGDSILVAECHTNRVQEVDISDDPIGSSIRFVGEGVLDGPQFVDCNTEFIAVAERCHRVSVLHWWNGELLAQFGSEGSGRGQLKSPRGLRLLHDGGRVVVADSGNHRLCVFSVRGKFKQAVGNLDQGPFDVLESCSDGSFVVVTGRGRSVVQLSQRGDVVDVYQNNERESRLDSPTALAALPNGGLVIREHGGGLHLFRGR
jgi:hypothetical protein